MKKELLVTQDIQRYNAVKDLLIEHNIKINTMTVDRRNPTLGLGSRSRIRMGSLGEQPKFNLMYYIYVKRKQYDEAKHLMDSIHP